ncbi:MAG: recombination protein RecR [Candidatus Eisenbacteria bacterium]|uniref:Recombination protein RecR n=1 Tax=Eiseniibacteriota bacterium TaxID=2212470 RepID=A0A849SIR1_UNCEI|nr:recombination protein RecR [Candidatus Eisenbacteria bacterium]
MYSSKYLELLIEELTKLPSIGQKSAQRLALHLLKVPKEDAVRLAEAIRAVRERVTFCSTCGNFTESDPCLICTDSQRDGALICVVEQPVDVLALERTARYRGRYHVLGGALSPLDGTSPEDLRIQPLLERLRGGTVREVILATNPNVAGEATALYLSRLLAPLGVSVTRIARGVPMGSDLEYSDMVTLARALEGRREVE